MRFTWIFIEREIKGNFMKIEIDLEYIANCVHTAFPILDDSN